jgi:hypothetical protein
VRRGPSCSVQGLPAPAYVPRQPTGRGAPPCARRA